MIVYIITNILYDAIHGCKDDTSRQPKRQELCLVQQILRSRRMFEWRKILFWQRARIALFLLPDLAQNIASIFGNSLLKFKRGPNT